MDKLNQPRLSAVAPLLDGIVTMSIWLNAVITIALYVQAPNRTLVVAGSYTLTYVWAFVFFMLFAVLLYGKISNKWVVLRNALIAGLFVKAIFTYALIVLGLTVGFKGIIGVTGLWTFATGVQFYAVRNFKLPGTKYVK